MRIAVCYSGIYREFSGWKENHKLITDHADSVYYSTWEGLPQPPVDNVITFPEPVVEYDPWGCEYYLQLYPEYPEVAKYEQRPHSTKQILAHQYIVDHIDDYDLIIRMRYDTWLGDHNWQDFIREAYETQYTYTFGLKSWKEDSLQLYVSKPMLVTMYEVTTDFMIMHTPHRMRNAHKLHKEEKLFGAEMGWYQVLVKPYGNASVRTYCGGIQLSRWTDIHEKHYEHKISPVVVK